MSVQASAPRFKKRVPCELSVNGRRHPGIVLNLSRGGLYVQTSLGLDPGAPVDLALNAPHFESPISVQATVVWKKVVSQTLRGMAHGGMGLRIQDAARSYDGLLYDIEAGQGARTATRVPPRVKREAKPAPPRSSYQVRLALTGSPRTKTLTIEADSEEQASALAGERAGEGWSILELREV